MLDLLIRNAEIVDGSGAPRFRADVAVQDGRIAELGQLEGAEGGTTIDASGCVVTPGFVDIHSHADFTLPLCPTADSLVHQGITTVVTGQCGASPVPLLEETRQLVLAARESEDRPLPWDRWSTFASYLDYLREIGTSVNAVQLVGQGAVRSAVMGYTAGRADEDQMTRMQAEVVKAMESGAIGLSTGLIYPPGSYASTEELAELARPVGERHGYYFSHIRGEGETLLEAIAEAIHIGRETGAAVQISHLKAARRDNWDKAEQALELIDRARAEGLDVTADMYPYTASNTDLLSLLPGWVQEGGKEATLERLGDPGIRRQMLAEIREGTSRKAREWDKILISDSPVNRSYEGRSIEELSAAAGKSPWNWVLDALLETGLDVSIILFGISEENIKMQLRHPAIMIGTDAGGRSIKGLLSKGVPHPRNYGTCPRVLARYVRAMNVLSLEEAVRKMSGLAAQKLRWSDRGLVREGYAADLAVLDLDTVSDQATYEDPHQYPAGIQHVIVNGELVIHAGIHTKARPGAVLGRQ